MGPGHDQWRKCGASCVDGLGQRVLLGELAGIDAGTQEAIRMKVRGCSFMVPMMECGWRMGIFLAVLLG